MEITRLTLVGASLLGGGRSENQFQGQTHFICCRINKTNGAYKSRAQEESSGRIYIYLYIIYIIYLYIIYMIYLYSLALNRKYQITKDL